jgi:hypothetical protein
MSFGKVQAKRFDEDPSLSDFSNKEVVRRFEIAVYSVIGPLSRQTGRDPQNSRL